MPSDRSDKGSIAQQIVQQATRLFAARGFVGASLHDIAKAVGIRKPSLLYHFPTKDELRRRVLEQMLAHWNETVPRILRAATSGPEQFDAITQETIAFFSADPDRARLLLRELLDRPEEMKPLIERHVAPWTRIVCDYIRKGQEQGRIHADVDPEAYLAMIITLVLSAVSLHGVMSNLVLDAERPPGQAEPSRLVTEMMRVARRSLFISPSADDGEDRRREPA